VKTLFDDYNQLETKSLSNCNHTWNVLKLKQLFQEKKLIRKKFFFIVFVITPNQVN